ncbi:MAG: hypothetical protein KGQ66_16640 [Acidobacteriota bacterium]|nr:hypothetical protein [Acidobacteriota bacterium]
MTERVVRRIRGRPARRARVVAALGGAAGLILAGGTATLGPGSTAADAQTATGCSTGVLVAVDFSAWATGGPAAGPVDLGCAPASGTGYDAMTAAGFITAGTQEEGPAFVCRIGLASTGPSSFEPTPAQDPCINTPPLNAYWSYWHADAGQSTWSYTQLGVMSYRPPAGSITAWTFGASNVNGTTGQPWFSPDQVRAAAQVGGSGQFIAVAAPATTVPATTPAGGGGGGGGATTTTSAAPAQAQPGTQGQVAAGASSAAPASEPAATSSPAARGAAGSSPAGGQPPPPGAPTGSAPTSEAGSPSSPDRSGAARTGSGPAGSGPAGTGRAGAGQAGRANSGYQIVASAAGNRRPASPASGPSPALIAGVAAAALLAAAGALVAWRRRAAG